jgi:hypothetical protein
MFWIKYSGMAHRNLQLVVSKEKKQLYGRMVKGRIPNYINKSYGHQNK